MNNKKSEVGAMLIYKKLNKKCELLSIDENTFTVKFNDNTIKTYSISTLSSHFVINKNVHNSVNGHLLIENNRNMLNKTIEKTAYEQIELDFNINNSCQDVQKLVYGHNLINEALKNENKELKEKVLSLENKNKQLEQKIIELENIINTTKPKNAGGRNNKFSAEEIEQILYELNNEKSYRQIATIFNCSKSLIHNIAKQFKVKGSTSK